MDVSRIKDKVLLITGGTGSFGNAVLRRFLSTDHFKEIRIFSRDEKKQNDMRIELGTKKVQFYLGDVRDPATIDQAMAGVDYVFHAAALKQVPSCEFFPLEAVKTNVFGSANVVRSAAKHGVTKVICLSTDKAAYPINAMGMSKALMEKVIVAESRSLTDTVVCLTRYGNVMGSRGSVIPLFAQQLRSDSDVTITNPEMTRFLMSLDDAVELVLFAFENGNQGDLFVSKAPASTIIDLAEAVSKVVDKKLRTAIIGTRHGEKLYETLCTKEEMAKAIDHGDFYRVPADGRDLNYSSYYEDGREDFNTADEYNSHNTVRLNVEEVAAILKSTPEILGGYNK